MLLMTATSGAVIGVIKGAAGDAPCPGVASADRPVTLSPTNRLVNTIVNGVMGPVPRQGRIAYTWDCHYQHLDYRPVSSYVSYLAATYNIAVNGGIALATLFRYWSYKKWVWPVGITSTETPLRASPPGSYGYSAAGGPRSAA